MSVRPGSGGLREPDIRSSMYHGGTATASASSSGVRLISRKRRRNSAPTVSLGFAGDGTVISQAPLDMVGASKWSRPQQRQSSMVQGSAPVAPLKKGPRAVNVSG